MTRDDSVDALARHLAGGFDILVNNAGVSFQGFDAEIARKTLDVNFYGAMRTTDRLLSAMRRDGRIVMVSSGMGELSAVSPELRGRLRKSTPHAGRTQRLCDSFVRDVAAGTHAENGWPSSAYRVSKIALNAFTRLLARELASDPRRILVNAVCPGWVRTDMGSRALPVRRRKAPRLRYGSRCSQKAARRGASFAISDRSRGNAFGNGRDLSGGRAPVGECRADGVGQRITRGVTQRA